jgi:hypothetical protein
VTSVSEEGIAPIIRVERIGALRTMLGVRTHISEDYMASIIRVEITNIVSSLLILYTLMTEAIHSSETSIHTRAAWRHIQEDGFLHIHRRENFKSYIALTGWAL